MINRIFFISEKTFPPGTTWPAEENVFFSLLVNPSDKQNLADTYAFIASTNIPVSLTLNIREPLNEESIRFITSFLFILSYLRIENRQVVNFTGDSNELLVQTVSDLSAYFTLQGIDDVIINVIDEAKVHPLFNSPDKLISYYKEVLISDDRYDNNIFFMFSSPGDMQAVLASLQETENEFRKTSPRVYSLIISNKLLQKEVGQLERKIRYTTTELGHQKQYGDVLRSHHPTRELQDYYNKEYEILPRWYKRFGHLIKVITGKRTFRSLFRDDVKKYKS